MTFAEAYTSLKSLYKSLMFPKNPHAQRWTLDEIDQMDHLFFYELMEFEQDHPQEEEVYLSDVW